LLFIRVLNIEHRLFQQLKENSVKIKYCPMKGIPTTPNQRRFMSKTDKFLALVQKGGCSVSVAKKKLKTTDQGVYGMAYAIRRRGIALLINESGEYTASTGAGNPVKEDIPKGIRESLSVIPPEFRDESLGVLHRAMFYQSVFKAQVETSMFIQGLRHA
jgi:hypothetical protein